MSNTDTWIPSGVMYNFAGAVIQNFANGNALKYDSYHLSSGSAFLYICFLDKEAHDCFRGLLSHMYRISNIDSRWGRAGQGGLSCNIIKMARKIKIRITSVLVTEGVSTKK